MESTITGLTGAEVILPASATLAVCRKCKGNLRRFELLCLKLSVNFRIAMSTGSRWLDCGRN